MQYRRPGFDPWVGKILWRKKWQCNRGRNYFHVKNNLKHVKKHGLPIMALGFEQTRYGWGQLPLVIIRLASRVIRMLMMFYYRCYKDAWECSGTPGTMFCSMQSIQIRTPRAEQAKELKDDLIASLKNNGTFYSSLQDTEDFEVKCPVIQRWHINQQAKVTGGFRFQISTKNYYLSSRGGQLPNPSELSLTLEDHLSRRLMKEWSSSAAKAVLSNTQASYSGRGP